MMEVLMAQNLGFCSGVKLAMNVVRDAIALSKELNVPCYIYGDIVHNSYVIDRIKDYGVISFYDDIDIAPGVLIIRTHGITDKLREDFIKKGFIIKDATCPVVLHNQNLVRSSEKDVIIFGFAGHSEVISLSGATDGKVLIVDSPKALDMIDRGKSYNAIVQTTFSSGLLESIKERVHDLGLDITFLNDICMSSKLRRDGVRKLKGNVDAMFIVGDKKSANTNELYTLARDIGFEAFLISNVNDISPDMLAYDKIGITAGASTPKELYVDVETYLRSINNGK